MIKQLIKLSNHLDKKGLTKEADYLDAVIRRMASPAEKDSNFGEEFIRLSRDIHFLNDTRAKIKLDINNHTGSKIKEIKEYTSYWYLYFFSRYFIKLWTKKVINK